MDQFAKLTGRQYNLFDYFGAPDADRVIVIMGSGADVTHEAVEHMLKKGEKVGVLKVRLFRPWSAKHFVEALPKTRQDDRGPRSHQGARRDRRPALPGRGHQLRRTRHTGIKVVAGRYGLSSKEFTPAMVMGVYAELKKAQPKQHFTVGIVDDVTKLSIDYDMELSIEPDDVKRAVFFGLGADGTVGANKNSIKIIGEETDNFAQGYFVYDSKKSGAITISHLRFGPRQIRSAYLIKHAQFVACHQHQLPREV